MAVKLWNLLWDFFINVLHFILYDLLRIRLSEEKWEGLIQFIKFGIVGVSSTVVNYVIYLAALFLFQKQKLFPSLDYLIAQVTAFFLSVLWSYLWNSRYVFHANRQETSWLRALLKTYISYAFTGLFLNTVLSYIWVEVIGVPKVLPPLLNIVFVVPINFFLNKFWAYKDMKVKS